MCFSCDCVHAQPYAVSCSGPGTIVASDSFSGCVATGKTPPYSAITKCNPNSNPPTASYQGYTDAACTTATGSEQPYTNLQAGCDIGTSGAAAGKLYTYTCTSGVASPFASAGLLAGAVVAVMAMLLQLAQGH